LEQIGQAFPKVSRHQQGVSAAQACGQEEHQNKHKELYVDG